MRNKFIYIALIFLLSTSACTVTRWRVIDQDKVDNSDFELLSNTEFLLQTGQVTPERPVFSLELFSRNEYEYTRKIESERTIQKYRPRTGFVLLSLLGASAAIYAAYDLQDNQPDSRDGILYATGGALGVLGFLNSKPVGEPTRTGEKRLLRKSGTEVRVDTVRTTSQSGEVVQVSVFYQGDIVVERSQRNFDNGQLEMNLASEIQPQNYGANPDEAFRVEVVRQGRVNNYEIPVTSIFQAFVEVQEEVSPLRNAPEVDRANVIIDLALGSQLELIEVQGEWTKVQYGSYQSYIATEDINILWRPSDFAQRISVIEVPFVPFGNIDVESDIPVLSDLNVNKSALIVVNENYVDQSIQRAFARRDGQLIEAYLQNGLGFLANKISSSYDFESSAQPTRAYTNLLSTFNEGESDVFVFLSGRGGFNSDGHPTLLTTDGISEAGRALDLNILFEALAALDAQSVVVIADIDFSANNNPGYNLDRLASVLTDANENAAVMFSTEFGNPSGVFMSAYGDQKRHYIFPYYFANALKEGHTTINDIKDYLDRNVSYTSRRLFNLPQEVVVFGNLNIDLAQ